MKRRAPKPTQRRDRRSKGKSRALQNWVAEKVSHLLDIPWGRDELVEARQMGQSGTDVVLRGPALERFPFAIECASGETVSWTSKVRQARKHREGMSKQHKFMSGRQWLLFLKRKEFQTPVVLMDADLFFTLMSCALNANHFYNPAGADDD